MESSNFYSALWDVTTYESVSEKEKMFMLYLDKVGSDRGFVKTEFLGLEEIYHAHAERIIPNVPIPDKVKKLS